MVALVSVPAAAMPGRNLADRVMGLLERVDYRRAETAEEREAIFRLRYQAYLREGAIPPNAERALRRSRWTSTDNAWIFGVYVDGELASSIRLHVASRQSPDLPALNVFSDLLSPEIAAGKTIIDPTRFVADRAASRRYPGAVLRDDAAGLAGLGVFPAPACCWRPCGRSIRPSTGACSATG